MTVVFLSWGASLLAIAALAGVLGRFVVPMVGWLGILIDQRGRYSLTHFQLVTWTIVVLSLISGVFWGRLLAGVKDPLSFAIPPEVLGLMGIALGSSVATTVAKGAKGTMAPERIAASGADPPRLAQIFLLEEGGFADRAVDVTKFQNFVITLILAVAYSALSVHSILDARTVENISALPGFAGTFLTLLGISHAAYVTGKLPNQAGTPPGLTMANRVGLSSNTMPPGVAPRNHRS